MTKLIDLLVQNYYKCCFSGLETEFLLTIEDFQSDLWVTWQCHYYRWRTPANTLAGPKTFTESPKQFRKSKFCEGPMPEIANPATPSLKTSPKTRPSSATFLSTRDSDPKPESGGSSRATKKDRPWHQFSTLQNSRLKKSNRNLRRKTTSWRLQTWRWRTRECTSAWSRRRSRRSATPSTCLSTVKHPKYFPSSRSELFTREKCWIWLASSEDPRDLLLGEF